MCIRDRNIRRQKNHPNGMVFFAYAFYFVHTNAPMRNVSSAKRSRIVNPAFLIARMYSVSAKSVICCVLWNSLISPSFAIRWYISTKTLRFVSLFTLSIRQNFIAPHSPLCAMVPSRKVSPVPHGVSRNTPPGLRQRYTHRSPSSICPALLAKPILP